MEKEKKLKLKDDSRLNAGLQMNVMIREVRVLLVETDLQSKFEIEIAQQRANIHLQVFNLESFPATRNY